MRCCNENTMSPIHFQWDPECSTQHSKLQDLTLMFMSCYVNCLRLSLLSLTASHLAWMRESTAESGQLANEAGATQCHTKLQYTWPSRRFFVHSCSQRESVTPPFSSGYLTLSSVCSSCCDQRASRFRCRFICQPAQQGTRCGRGKGDAPAHETAQHRRRCHTACCRLVLKQWYWPLDQWAVKSLRSLCDFMPADLAEFRTKEEMLCE